MARIGRPPKPDAVKALAGTLRRDRMLADAVRFPAGCPTPPAHLKGPAKRVWGTLAPLLSDAGVLSQGQAVALEGMCQAYAAAIQADENIRRKGRVVKTPNGQLQISPWESLSKQRWSEVRQWCIEFGMTPAAQGKVSSTKKPGDAAADFLFGGAPLVAIAGGKGKPEE